ncbi:MAG: sulfotransferase, partial [Candidatus Methylomirabilales bacterium]
MLFRATLRALNRIGEGVERVGIRSLSLDERELRAVACRETGLSDSGDEDFREPLSQLLHALESEARLTLVGRIVARADIVGLLANRLRLEEDRRRHPEIGEERIRRPVFIVGLPRSGSTLLHHLLAQDPASRAARAWEVMEP